MAGPTEPIGQATASETGLLAQVGSAIDALHTPRVRYFAPVLMGLIMLFDSWDSAVIAFVMPSLIQEWKLAPLQVGATISAGYAGQFIGALVLGGLAEKYGRLRVFIPSVLLMCLLALACGLAVNLEMLGALRFAQGILIGGALPVAATYINEIAPTRERGRFFGVYQTLNILGYTMASFSSILIVPLIGWRWMFALGGIPLLMLPIVMWKLPESPRWLARSGNLQSVNNALAKLGGCPIDAPADGEPVQSAADQRAPISALFARDLRGRTFVLMVLWFCTTMISLGMTTWVPSIFTTVYKFPIQEALRISGLKSILFLIMMPLVALILDQFGRRKPAITATSISTIALFTLAVISAPSFSLLVTLIIFGHLATGMATMILWPYSAETFPTRVRAVGLGFVSSFARASSMVTPLFIGAAIGVFGSVRPVFALFGLCSLIILVLWVIRTRETAGIRLEDVK